jgi:hypothetical protein
LRRPRLVSCDPGHRRAVLPSPTLDVEAAGVVLPDRDGVLQPMDLVQIGFVVRVDQRADAHDDISRARCGHRLSPFGPYAGDHWVTMGPRRIRWAGFWVR